MRPYKSALISKLILTALLVLTLGSGSKAVQLAHQPTLSERQDRIFDIVLVTSSLGGKALIIWLNHRHTEADKPNDEDG